MAFQHLCLQHISVYIFGGYLVFCKLRCFPDLMGLPVSFQSKGYWSISTYHLPVLILASSGGVATSLNLHNDPWCQEETCLVCGNRFCCSRNSTESTHSMLTWQSNHSTAQHTNHARFVKVSSTSALSNRLYCHHNCAWPLISHREFSS